MNYLHHNPVLSSGGQHFYLKGYTMKEFEHPNMNGFVCPLCKTNEDSPVVLVAIPGTEEDGLVQAKQVHSKCLNDLLKDTD
jgi:hypothetical protein